MAYRLDPQTNGTTDIVIDGWEKGISASPYQGIANIRNINTSYYPGVAYVNYKRQGCTLVGGTMTNPVQEATSPAGLNYILDDSGQIWKQNAVNSSTFNLLGTTGRIGTGAGGLAYWNNYLVVFGNGMIEFNGNGTGDNGITDTNWNITPQTTASVTSAGYNSLSGTINNYAYATTWVTAPTTGATSATLGVPAGASQNWQGTSGAYNIHMGVHTIAATFTNGSSGVSFSALPTDTYSTAFYALTLQLNTVSGITTFYQNDPVTFSIVSGALPTPLVAGTTYYLAAPINTALNGAPIIVSATPNGPFIGLTSTGTGGYNITDSVSLMPIQNQISVGIAFNTAGSGSTAATLTNLWTYPSGMYNIVDPIGDNIQANFLYNSTLVTLLNPTVFQPTGTYQVQIINPTPATSQAPYRAYNSKVDGNLYFANGRWVGRIAYSNNINAVFNPGLPQTYSVSYAATGTLQEQDTVIDMTDLRGSMIISGNFDIYPWDYVSVQPSASSPVGEQIYRLVNLLNNIYILAGQKGNIYVSNGASAQLFYKIADYIAGVIDPVFLWGGIMVHRSKLYFQLLVEQAISN